ncbi:hypothetical protein B9Z55_013302 [Caenorhabditis nigoni]|uniref:DNA-directed DNA polymerase n=1 Tax=Caenorhabditis nigoni TaxID=1611254 RepID=A0A2G5U137_9PELO|nr:hypothetical protein B9Z55_013302 [Caenorhabditis nigoni]
MELVGSEDIRYTDTDSIIFTTPEGGLNPLEAKRGPYLGKLTNELAGKMTEFVTLGPKTYAYKETLANGEEKVVVKAKGITINSVVERKLSFDRVKSMVEEVIGHVAPRTALLLPQMTMVRDKAHNVYCRNIVKTFKYTINKRRLLSDGTTLPFGFSE